LEVVVSLQLVMVLVKYVEQDHLEEEEAGHGLVGSESG
jgi:hypothetical protein